MGVLRGRCLTEAVRVPLAGASGQRVLREAGIIEMRLDGTRKLTSLRRAELEATCPGLLDSILRAPVGRRAGAERAVPKPATREPAAAS